MSSIGERWPGARPYEPLTITIDAGDRYWVADALMAYSRQIDEAVRSRRRKTKIMQNQLEMAERLWRLSQKIAP